jgi:hypothetical protein
MLIWQTGKNALSYSAAALGTKKVLEDRHLKSEDGGEAAHLREVGRHGPVLFHPHRGSAHFRQFFVQTFF